MNCAPKTSRAGCTGSPEDSGSRPDSIPAGAEHPIPRTASEGRESTGRPPETLQGFTRRQFLRNTASLLGLTLIPGPLLRAAIEHEGIPGLWFRLLRAQDLLDLEVALLGFSENDHQYRADPLGGAAIALTFPGQNIAEKFFDEADLAKDPQLAQAYLSGPSWLVFSVPAEWAGKTRSLGDWLTAVPNFTLRVPDGADGGAFEPAMPTSGETSLEIPFRLFIAPRSSTAFELSSGFTTPLDPSKPVELWHGWFVSRVPLDPPIGPQGTLAQNTDLAPPAESVAQARAIFSPDYSPITEPSLDGGGYPNISLQALTRHLLVRQMSKDDGSIDIERLILSTLGANASLYYASRRTVSDIIEQQLAGKVKGTHLVCWKHQMTLGRDNYYVEAYLGFLFPFCHPCVYVEVTKRRFRGPKDADATPGAYLLKRRFILVQEAERRFADNTSVIGRAMPIKRVLINKLQSEDLVKGAPSGVEGLYFFPQALASGTDVMWDIEIEDAAGKIGHTSEAKLFFASNIASGASIYAGLSAADRTIPLPAPSLALTSSNASLRVDCNGVRAELPVVDAGERPIQPPDLDPGLMAEVGSWLRRKAVNRSEPDLPTDNLGTAERAVVKTVFRALDRIRDENTFGSHVQDLATQIERLARRSADVEAMALTFSAAVVREETRVANEILSKIDRLTQTGEALVSTELPKLLDTALATLGIKDPAAVARCQEKVGSMARAAVRAAGADLTRIKGLLTRYLDEVAQAREALQQGGWDTVQPALESALVNLPAVRGVADNLAPRAIAFAEHYLLGGFAEAANGVYAKLDTAIGRAEAAGQALARGGIASPQMIFSGISRDLGAVASASIFELTKLAQSSLQTVDLTSVLPDARIFGVLRLSDLIGAVASGSLPEVLATQFPDHIDRTWKWQVPVQSRDVGILQVIVKQRCWLSLQLATKVRLKPLEAGQLPSLKGELTAYLGGWDEINRAPAESKQDVFSLRLLGLIEAGFSSVNVQQALAPDASPVVEPHVSSVNFLGPLTFVNVLQKHLGGGGNALKVQLDGEAISIVTRFTIPPINCGVFLLQAVPVTSTLRLPVSGHAGLRYEFSFASKEQRFLASVSGYAATGYLTMALDTRLGSELEGAIDFGGAKEFKLGGVASGGLYILGGAYFRIASGTTELAGYVRAGGHLNVLGLINASVSFILALVYRKTATGTELYGTCTITVSIDLGFWDIKQSVTMTQQLQGCDKDRQQPLGLLPRPSLAGVGPTSTPGVNFAVNLDRMAATYAEKYWDGSEN